MLGIVWAVATVLIENSATFARLTFGLLVHMRYFRMKEFSDLVFYAVRQFMSSWILFSREVCTCHAESLGPFLSWTFPAWKVH